MAVAENPNGTPKRDWTKRESFTSAMVQILIVAVVLAGAVFFYYQRGTRRKEVAERLKEARAFALRDNPKDLAKAAKELEAIFALDSGAKDALALAADIETERWVFHRVEGAEQKARDYLKRAAAQESKSEDRFGNQVVHLLAEGKAAEAEQYAEELRKQGASSAKLWYGLAMAYAQQGNIPLARQAFSQATDKAWKNPRYYAAYGEALLALGDYRQAVSVLEKGRNANADHLRVILDLALARIYRADRVKDATDALNEVLGRDDLTPGLQARAFAVQAELANFEQRYDDAIVAADQSLAINPGEDFALLARARALALKKDPGALDAFKKALSDNATAPVVYFTGARLLQDGGNHDGAMELLNAYEQKYTQVQVTDATGKTAAAIARDDNYWIIRGDILKAAGKNDEAMAAYEKAIAADSLNLARAHYAKGALLFTMKDLDKALEELALVTPEDGTGHIPEAYDAKGRVLFAKGDFANGCQNFAFALTKMRAQQQPREKLNGLLQEVTSMLVANKQKEMSKLWEKEAAPLIQ